MGRGTIDPRLVETFKNCEKRLEEERAKPHPKTDEKRVERNNIIAAMRHIVQSMKERYGL